MKYNDTIIKGTDHHRVLGVCDEVIYYSYNDNHTKFCGSKTKQELLADGWTVEEPEWVPEKFEKYFYICYGDVDIAYWHDDELDIQRTAMGQYKTRAEAEAMRDKLLAVVKENQV